MISEALRRLGVVSADYSRRADEYGTLADEAARAEAEHRSERARAIIRVKTAEDGARMSVAEAETRADADEHISALYTRRLVAAAAADAARAKLRQLHEQVAVGRSFAAAERAENQFAATGPGTT